MGRGQTPTAATAASRPLLGFIAAVIVVLTLRQGTWALLHVAGSSLSAAHSGTTCRTQTFGST